MYLFEPAENYVLKLMTYLLIRKYDGLFAPGLYSFRANQNVKRAVQSLTFDRHIGEKFIYKVDIHDYFNSVDVEFLLPRLRRKPPLPSEAEAVVFILRL